MYWLSCVFEIKSSHDLRLLRKAYLHVPGEATLDNKIEIKWTSSLCDTIPDDYVGKIRCRLRGPATIFNMCVKVDKQQMDHNKLSQHNRYETLLKWAKKMDGAVEYEMKRVFDVGVHYGPFNPPVNVIIEQKNESIGGGDIYDLYLAAVLSSNVEYFLPLLDGVIVANTKSVYLSYLPYNLREDFDGRISGLVFDLNHGFKSVFQIVIDNEICDDQNKNLDYLNRKYKEQGISFHDTNPYMPQG